jgi:TetR/AcrR family transcriptional regulator, tetracycline repressor protein
VPRHPGQRAGLTKERVLAAAGELLAEKGLPALTMRAVAQRLAVAPNAIYSHVASKSELVDEVLDAVLAGVDVRRDADPAEALFGLMASTRRVLLQHPDLVPVYLARQGAHGANAQRLGAALHGMLADAGVSDDEAQEEARRVLIIYTIGSAAFVGGGPVRDGSLDRHFEAGLRWLLAGILNR